MLNISIDLKKLPDDVNKRHLALLEIFHELAREVTTVGGDFLTSTIPVLSRQGPGSVRVGQWQVTV